LVPKLTAGPQVSAKTALRVFTRAQMCGVHALWYAHEHADQSQSDSQVTAGQRVVAISSNPTDRSNVSAVSLLISTTPPPAADTCQRQRMPTSGCASDASVDPYLCMTAKPDQFQSSVADPVDQNQVPMDVAIAAAPKRPLQSVIPATGGQCAPVG
jgi:hypothetical protein